MTFALPEEPTGDVLVLGAGFSHVLADSGMPMTDELGFLAVEEAGVLDDERVPAGFFSQGTFEDWLSRLAEDQPDLSPEANLSNRALFQRLARAIHSVLEERERVVLGSEGPTWLPELLSTMHVRQATAITFNYDNLLEYGVAAHDLPCFGFRNDEGPVHWFEVTGDQPPPPPYPARLGYTPVPTFRLLKLHGSLNWYWVPGDESGATLNRADIPGAWGEPPLVSQTGGTRRYLPGREPFIIPPAAAKSAYYRNPLSRQLWQQARKALRDASSVALVGYSIPVTDLVTSGMLADTLVRGDATIAVVNPDPEPVVHRLVRLGVSEDRFAVHAGKTAVMDFVGAYRRDAAVDFATGFFQWATKDGADSPPLMVGWSKNAVSAVTAVKAVNGLTELTVEEITPFFQANRARHGGDSEPVNLGDLLAGAHPSSPLVAVRNDGTRLHIVGAQAVSSDVGHATRWIVLLPAGAPPTP